MNSRISDLARYTVKLLRDIENTIDEIKKVDGANDALTKAIDKLKGLKLDDLCAIEEEKRHELTTRQQEIIECYAILKRVLLEVYRDLFQAIKGM
jgi:hypothetical protein